MTKQFNTRTTEGLLDMFYNGAQERNAVQTFERGGSNFDQFRLTQRQFKWLCDVERKTAGAVHSNHGRKVIAYNQYDVTEQMHGSATVNVRK